MGFQRPLVSPNGKLLQPMRAGDGFLANPNVTDNAADAVLAITTTMLSGGFLIQSIDLGADRVWTLPTAALIFAEFPEMDIGDSFVFVITNASTADFDVILAVDTGGILGSAGGNVVFQASRTFVLVKTAAATFTVY